jgi:hypothetical protein
MGIVAANDVRFPAEVATHFAEAITAARLALVGLDAWAKDQPAPVRIVGTRALQFWRRAIALTEPLLVTAEKS